MATTKQAVDPRKGKGGLKDIKEIPQRAVSAKQLVSMAESADHQPLVPDATGVVEVGEYRVSIARFDPAVPLDQLLANPDNYRVHPPQQRHIVDGSLRTFGWVAPLMVNEVTGHIIDGHLRMDQAMAVGDTTAPCNYVRLTPAEEKALLAVYDPMTALALHDATKHMALLQDATQVDDENLQNYMMALADKDRETIGPDDGMGQAMGTMVEHEVTDTGRTAGDKLATYESATIRQLVLHYGPQDYGAMLDHLQWARDHWGVETNAEAMRETLRQYRAEHEGTHGMPEGGDTEALPMAQDDYDDE
jgi:hypothetical protein